MNTLAKRYKIYAVTLVSELAFSVLINLPQTLKGTSICAGNSACGWSLAIIILLFAPIPILWIYGAAENRLQPIFQRWERISKARKERVFSLSRSQKTRDEIIYLDLCNKINPNIAVSQIEIGNKDKVFSHRNETFSLSKKECKEIPFIKVSKIYSYFAVVDDIKETDFDQYKQGKHKFDIAVTYSNGSIQWFYVLVSYKEPDQITLEINDD